MANPNVAQGTLNRLRGSVVVPGFTNLNITAPYLGRAGIGISFEGETTAMVPTMVGTVTSPAPYQMVTVTAAILKTQSLSAAWENQRQTLSTIGDITITTDTQTLPDYTFNNCAIENVRELNFSGEDAGFVITIRGYYQVNADLWNI